MMGFTICLNVLNNSENQHQNTIKSTVICSASRNLLPENEGLAVHIV